MTSSYHVGIYPNIIEQMKSLIDIEFKDSQIIRLKIQSLATNNGVPDNDIDKLLFWNETSNYFQFHYEIFIKSKMELKRLKQLCNDLDLYLAPNALNKASVNEMYQTVSMRLFDVGRINAFISNNRVIQSLTNNNFPPVKVEEEFTVYDLDNRWSHITSNLARTYSTATDARPRFRHGYRNRKAFRRSTD